jgi:SAM-dependent methyltransferase
LRLCSGGPGPSLGELARQALSSVEGGYDRLAPKFDHTPFRTADTILGATAGVLGRLGPFGPGLDVCCGTGAGLAVLAAVGAGPIAGVDFSAGMLDQARAAGADRTGAGRAGAGRVAPEVSLVRADARELPFAGGFDLAVSFGALGHFRPAERPALLAGVYRALRPGGTFAVPIAAPPPIGSRWYWGLAGFDLAMRVRNAVWRPPFVMYYRTAPLSAVGRDLAGAGFSVTVVPLAGLGRRRDGSPRYGLLLARKPGPRPGVTG